MKEKIKTLMKYYENEIRSSEEKILIFKDHNFKLEAILEKEKLDIYKRILYDLENII